MVAAQFSALRAGRLHFKGAEVAGDIGAAEFVIERCCANGPFEHDVERGNDAPRFTEIVFPRLFIAGNAQVGHREAAQTCFGLGTVAGGAFVADFAARTCRCARERGNRGGVVVGFHLHQDVNRFVGVVVFAGFYVGQEARCQGAFDDGGVVMVGGEDAFGRVRVGVADHGKQRFGLFFAVNDPVGVEDFMAAMFRIGLREHHQFYVGGVALEFGVIFREVVDFIRGKCQTPVSVGFGECRRCIVQNVDVAQRRRLGFAKQDNRILRVCQHHFGHAVVQQRSDCATLGGGE